MDSITKWWLRGVIPAASAQACLGQHAAPRPNHGESRRRRLLVATAWPLPASQPLRRQLPGGHGHHIDIPRGCCPARLMASGRHSSTEHPRSRHRRIVNPARRLAAVDTRASPGRSTDLRRAGWPAASVVKPGRAPSAANLARCAKLPRPLRDYYARPAHATRFYGSAKQDRLPPNSAPADPASPAD